jgi:protein-disulfide isomerase
VARADAAPATIARVASLGLTLALFATGGATAGELDLSPDERAAFGAEVRALLLAEPQIVARGIGLFPVDPFGGYAEEAARDAALLTDLAADLTEDRGDWAEGPQDGVPLVAFLPPACSGCADLLADLRATAAASGARLVVKDAPEHEAAARFLTAILSRLGPEEWLEARAALAGLSEPDDPAALVGLAKTLGWDFPTLQADMTSAATRDRLARVAALADRLGFDVVPSYVAGGVLVRGDVPPALLARYLDR